MKTNSIYILFTTFCLCSASVAGVWYMHTQMNAKIDVIKDYSIRAQQNNNLEFGRELDTQIEKIKEYKDSIMQTFIHEDNLVSFVQQIEQIAEQNNVEVLIEKVDRSKAITISEKYNTQDARFYFNINGQYEQINNFLNELEKFENNILIEEFKLYQNRADDFVIYNARVVMMTKIIQYDKK